VSQFALTLFNMKTSYPCVHIKLGACAPILGSAAPMSIRIFLSAHFMQMTVTSPFDDSWSDTFGEPWTWHSV